MSEPLVYSSSAGGYIPVSKANPKDYSTSQAQDIRATQNLYAYSDRPSYSSSYNPATRSSDEKVSTSAASTSSKPEEQVSKSPLTSPRPLSEKERVSILFGQQINNKNPYSVSQATGEAAYQAKGGKLGEVSIFGTNQSQHRSKLIDIQGNVLGTVNIPSARGVVTLEPTTTINSRQLSPDTIETTTTTSWFLPNFTPNEKVAGFRTAEGENQYYVYNPKSDIFAISAAGAISVYPKGTQLKEGEAWITPQGERLYGGGVSAGEFYEAARAKGEKQNPFFFHLVPFLQNPQGEIGAIGANVAKKFTASVSFLGSLTASPITKRPLTDIGSMYEAKMNLSEQQFAADIKQVYIRSYTEQFSKTGMTPIDTSKLVIGSPAVQTVVFSAGGYGLAGGLAKELTITASTIPSIASKAIPLAAIGSEALYHTAVNIAAPGVLGLAAYKTDIYTAKAAQYKKLGIGSYQLAGDIGLEAGQTIISIKAFSAGFKEGLPIRVRGTSIFGTNVNTGVWIRGKNSAFQIYGKTAQLDEAGNFVYKYNWGTPKSVAIPSSTYDVSLSMAGAKNIGYVPEDVIGRKLLDVYGTYNPSYEQIVKPALSVRGAVSGAGTKFYDEDILGQSEAFKKLSPSSQRAVVQQYRADIGDVYQGMDLYKKYIYGGTGTKAQIKGDTIIKLEGYTGKGAKISLGEQANLPMKTKLPYRSTTDIDVDYLTQFSQYEAGKTVKALKETGTVAYQQGTTGVVKVKGTGKAFDIHGLDTPPELQVPETPYGFRRIEPVRVGKYDVSPLLQETTNKLASVGTLQPSGMFGTSSERAKDYADFFRIAQQEISNKIFISTSAKKAALGSLEGYKTGVQNIYGIDVSNFKGAGVSAISSSVSPSGISGSLGFIRFPSYSQVSRSSSISSISSPIISSSSSISKSLSSLSSSSKISSSISKSLSSSLSLSSSFSSSSSSSSRSSSSFSSSSSSSSSSSISNIVKTPPPIVPFIFPVGDLEFSPSRVLRGGKKKTGYMSSFSAFVFNIHGRYKKTAFSKSGIDFRPITRSFRIGKSIKIGGL